MDRDQVIAEYLTDILLSRKGSIPFTEVYGTLNKKFNTAFRTTKDLLICLRKFPENFEVYEHGGQVFVKLITKISICEVHCSKNDTCEEDSNCAELHICKFYALGGNCKYRGNCRYGHDLTTIHNAKLLSKTYLTNAHIGHIRFILNLIENRTKVTTPKTCMFYNKTDGCKHMSEKCPYLHICKYYIQDNCTYGTNCRRNHNIGDKEKNILKRHGFDTDKPTKDLLEELRTLCNAENDAEDDYCINVDNVDNAGDYADDFHNEHVNTDNGAASETVEDHEDNCGDDKDDDGEMGDVVKATGNSKKNCYNVASQYGHSHNHFQLQEDKPFSWFGSKLIPDQVAQKVKPLKKRSPIRIFKHSSTCDQIPGERPSEEMFPERLASASASIDRSINVQESQDNIQTMTGTTGLGQNSADGTDPTMTEFMKTIYDGSGTAPRQLITLQGTDTANSFSVYGQEVDIVASKQISSLKTQSLPGSTLNTGSNKVKTTPVVNYDWEQKRYIGNIVAVHRNNVYACYVLKGKSGGVVRVTNRKTAERTLLKDFVGRVIDLAFAHTDDVILAVVDEIGNMCVYEIKENEDRKIEPRMMLHVERPKSTLVSEYHRVIWCPYIPDDCDDSSATESSNSDNACRMLVLTNDEKAEIWGIDLVTKDHGPGPVYPDDVEMGLICIESHTKPIMDCAFSPDGTALATASVDGEVKFFQVYMHENTSPRCLHQWKPHGGKPMSCLFFLDDHKNVTPDAQFWKFAVTGADNNQEIKIWSCESWNCLQTVRFLCPQGLPSNFSVEPCMKAALDLSARYFILTDIRRRVLYVLQIHQESSSNTAHISSVSEFTLAQPCLSFAILDAGTKRFKKTKGDDSHLDEITTGEIVQDEDEENKEPSESTSGLGVQIKLYTVHPKALQELLIRFKPESSVPQPPPPSVSSISQGESGVMDALSDVSMITEGEGDRGGGDMSFSQVESSHPHPILMTPDAFKSSPRKHYPDDSILEGVRGSASSTSSFTQVSAMGEDFLSPRSSSGSTITQTPTTPKGPQSPAHAKQDVTPSSVPLPPVTTSEETELATPNSSAREVNVGELTPTQSADDAEALNNFFSQQKEKSDLQKVSLDSTGSTGHFDVTESRVHQKSQSSYDEMDEEVAEVMGEDVRDSYSEDLLGEATQYSEGGIEDGTQPFSGQGEEEMGTGGSSGTDVLTAWPKAPDLAGERSLMDRNDNNRDQIDAQEETTQDDYDVVIEEEENIDNDDGDGDEEEHEEEEDDEEKVEEEEEEIEEAIEEQEPSEESIGIKEEPKAAPVAGFALSPREQRPMEVREIHKEIVREVFDQEELQKLHSKIGSILQAMEAQQSQLDQLRQEMVDQQNQYLDARRHHMEQEQLRQVSQEAQPSMEEHLGKLENIVTSRVERLFNTHSQKENQRMQDLFKQTEARERQKQDQFVNTVSHSLSQTVTNNLERNVKTEFRNTVMPTVTKVMEPVKDQIHQELAQKLTATDSLLKDNIGKMVRSRQTVEAIGLAAGNAIQKPVQAAYRETFQNIVIPSFERATQNMCQQVGEVFQRGTKEYTRQLESHLEALRQKQTESRDPMLSELRKLTDSFQTSAEQMKSHTIAAINSQLQTQVQNAMTGVQDRLLQFVREAVKEEVSSAVKEQGLKISDSVLSAMRSGAVTPAVSVTPDPVVEKQHVLNLLRQGQLNAAFQQALSASNLEIVMMLCEAVNPSQVFNQTPCPLHQPVLLSLIQQLSADLENSTVLKHKYLEEAVMNLDLHDTVVQEHIKGVLYGLIQKLKLYIQAHPNDKMTKSLKMLLMASESLLK